MPRNPFRELIGIQTVSARGSESVVRLPSHPQIRNGRGVIHGGAIATLCDAAIGTALRSALSPGDTVATIELKVNFIAPGEGDLESRARILHIGTQTAVGEVEVFSGEGQRLVAKALATFFVRRGQERPRPGATTALDPEFDGPDAQ